MLTFLLMPFKWPTNQPTNKPTVHLVDLAISLFVQAGHLTITLLIVLFTLGLSHICLHSYLTPACSAMCSFLSLIGEDTGFFMFVAFFKVINQPFNTLCKKTKWKYFWFNCYVSFSFLSSDFHCTSALKQLEIFNG